MSPNNENSTTEPTEQAPPSPAPLPVIEAVPSYKDNPPPRYPRIARKRGYEGTVLLDVRVSPEGSVLEVKIAKSCGHGVLDRAAGKAVKGWVFEPGQRGKERIEMWVQVPVRFRLR
jgi:protein TonB